MLGDDLAVRSSGFESGHPGCVDSGVGHIQADQIRNITSQVVKRSVCYGLVAGALQDSECSSQSADGGISDKRVGLKRPGASGSLVVLVFEVAMHFDGSVTGWSVLLDADSFLANAHDKYLTSSGRTVSFITVIK